MDFMDIYAFFTIEASLFLNIYHSDSVRTSFLCTLFYSMYMYVYLQCAYQRKYWIILGKCKG